MKSMSNSFRFNSVILWVVMALCCVDVRATPTLIEGEGWINVEGVGADAWVMPLDGEPTLVVDHMYKTTMDSKAWMLVVQYVPGELAIYPECNLETEVFDPYSPNLSRIDVQCTGAEYEPEEYRLLDEVTEKLPKTRLIVNGTVTEGCRMVARQYDINQDVGYMLIDCTPIVAFSDSFEQP